MEGSLLALVHEVIGEHIRTLELEVDQIVAGLCTRTRRSSIEKSQPGSTLRVGAVIVCEVLSA